MRKSDLGKIVFAIFGVGSELKKLGFFGLEDIVSAKVVLNDTIERLDLLAQLWINQRKIKRNLI